MDQNGHDKIVGAFEATGMDMNLIEVLPQRNEISEEGARFISIVLLDPRLRFDAARSLKYANLLDRFGADEDGPALVHLPVGTPNEADLLYEDVTMRDKGHDDARAQEIYRVQPLDVLSLHSRQYNLMLRALMTMRPPDEAGKSITLEELVSHKPESLLSAVAGITEDDINLVNEALSEFNLSIGCYNDEK